MARTPLLRALRQLAREHDAAERLGVTPAELRRRRAAEPSRRDFLKGAAAVAALAPASRIVPALAASPSPPSIAIVGAGISGLTAALTLQDKGLDATVFEASPRIGGRMHSDRDRGSGGYWAEDQVSDFCGELIDSGHTTILGLAARFGLEVDDLLAAQPPGSTDTYWFLSRHYPAAQADEDFAPVRDAAKRDLNDAGYPTLWNRYKPAGYALDHTSVHRWIETRVPGGHSSPFGRLLDTAYNIEYGAETKEQSSLNLLYLLAYRPSPKGFAVFGVSDEQYHIRGGNDRLPEEIAKVLRDVRLGWRLTAIERGDRTVTLSFQTPEGSKQVV
ncbi:MAG TPA: FAD-dependent oxidoreductase, partial [Geminicoccaceae bacterium]|nr:FAD-dependent oxidoreductase [Geminicoccaceae bacterium]